MAHKIKPVIITIQPMPINMAETSSQRRVREKISQQALDAAERARQIKALMEQQGQARDSAAQQIITERINAIRRNMD